MRRGDRFGADAALLAHQRRIKVEIRELEAELDQLHASIATGVVPPDPDSGATTSALDAWILRSREFREHLQDKRSELARLQRTMAREERLSSKDAPRAKRLAIDERRVSREPSNESFVPTVTGERRSALIKAMKALVLSLKEHTARRAVKRIARSLLDRDPDVRREAVTLLGSMDSPAVFDVLLITAEDPSERVRLATLNGLAGLRNVAAAKVFRRFLGAESAPLRLAALRGLASLDASRLHSAELVAGIEDEDEAVRKAAAAILGYQQSEGAVSQRVLRALTFALSDEAESVRLSAAETLGAIGGQRAVFSLMRTIADPSHEVRAAGQRALRAIVGDVVDEIAVELPPLERVEALRQWWKGARVQGVTPSAQSMDFDEPAVRQPVVRPESAAPAMRRESAAVVVEPVRSRVESEVALASDGLDAELPVPDASLVGGEQAEDTSIFESDEDAGSDFESVMFGDDESDAQGADVESSLDSAGPDIAAKPESKAPEAKEKADEKAQAAPEEKADEPAKEKAASASEQTTAEAAEAAEEKPAAKVEAAASKKSAAPTANGDANGADADGISLPGGSDPMDFGLDAEEQEGGEQFESLFGDGDEEGSDDSSGDAGYESVLGDVADSGE